VRESLFAFALFVLAAAAADAACAANFSVSPLRLELSAAAPVAVVELGNSGDAPVTVQAQARSWTQSSGQDEYGEARPFIINPTIFTIPPAGRQVVRIALRGTPPRDVEGAYRLVMTEIPSATPGAAPVAPGFRVALRMDIPVYVSPQQPGAQPDPRFGLDPGGGRPRIVIGNGGAAHFRMVDVTVSDGAETVAALPVLVVLPGATRSIELPTAAAGAPREYRLQAESNSGPVDVVVRHAP
jgi:fimbrial chaperone protein